MKLDSLIASAISKIVELKLSGSQTAFLGDFFTIRKKPTNYKQKCPICSFDLHQEDITVKLLSGRSSSGWSKHIYYHADCFLAVVLSALAETIGGET